MQWGGFTVRTGCVGGLDCVSCVSDGVCVCSLVTLVVLCVFHLQDLSVFMHDAIEKNPTLSSLVLGQYCNPFQHSAHLSTNGRTNKSRGCYSTYGAKGLFKAARAQR